MRWKEWVLGLSTLLVASPLLATTYFGGFEDAAGSGSDYDFNDLVYTLSGSSLTLHTGTGSWLNQSSAGTLNTNSFQAGPLGTPFWNNNSQDGSGGYNIGWCMWGGGACNGGVGLAPGSQYLATANGGSVNDVYFSSNGSVTEQVNFAVALIKQSALGWELTSGVGGVHLFSIGVQGPVTFTPGGDFFLVVQSFSGTTYDSNAAASDGFSHFAFFTTPTTATPEPSTIGLLGFALVGLSVIVRKKISQS